MALRWPLRPFLSQLLVAAVLGVAGLTASAAPAAAQDDIKPTVSITSPPSGAWTGNSIQVNAAATDDIGLVDIELWGNGAVFGTIPCSGTTCSGGVWWSTGALPAGAYEMQAVATDTSGNVKSSLPVKINKDATAPVTPSGAPPELGSSGGGSPLVISWDHPSNGATMCTSGLAMGWVVVNGTGVRTGTFTVDGVHILDHNAGPGPDKKEFSYHWNTAGYESGAHTFTATIADETGANDSDTITVNLLNPTPAITSPSAGATVEGVVPVTITTEDACPTHEYTLFVDGATVGTVPATAAKTATIEWNTAGFADGSHQLTAQITGGGATTSTSVTVVVQNAAGGPDTTKPAVTITSPASDVWTGNSINVAASGTDDLALASIKLWGNGSVFATFPCTGATCSGNAWWATGPLPPGAYEVQAVATDAAGNTRTSAKVVIYKDATSPVTPSGAPPDGGAATLPLLAHVTSPLDGATVTGTLEIAMAADHTQGTLTQFVLKLGDATTLSSQSVSGAAAGFVWNTATAPDGPHTLHLTVTDGAGRTATAAVNVTISNGAVPPASGGDSTAPTVTITSPQTGDWTGNSIDVTATASDNVGLATLTFFGNGTQFAQISCGTATACAGTEWWVTGPLPGGQHTITVVATDTAGNTKTSAPVVINK